MSDIPVHICFFVIKFGVWRLFFHYSRKAFRFHFVLGIFVFITFIVLDSKIFNLWTQYTENTFTAFMVSVLATIVSLISDLIGDIRFKNEQNKQNKL